MNNIKEALDYKRKSKKSYREVAIKYGVNENLLREFSKGHISIIDPENPHIPNKQYTYGDAVIITDIHAPFQDNTYIAEIAKLGKHFNQAILLGDLTNMAALSTLGKGEYKTAPEVDICHAKSVLTYLLYYFGHITIMLGNHDERYTKKYNISFKEFIYNIILEGKYNDLITTTEYDYVIHNNSWVLGHASDYNKDSSIVPVTLSQRYNTNVMIGHQHMVSVNTINCKHAISLGCTANPDLFWYKERRLETYPEHVRGFGLIIDNNPVVFEEYDNITYNGVNTHTLSDWVSIGKDLYHE